MNWTTAVVDYNYDWKDGSKIIARVTKLGPREWAWDVIGIPNAAGRTSTLKKAQQLAEAAYNEYNAANIRYQVYDRCRAPWGMCTHLKIWREDKQEITLSWSELQLIKNEAVGEEMNMVEFYPPEQEVVNEVNMRHFWSVEFDTPMKP